MDAHARTVMITGAAGNLGRTVARRFLDAGAKLVLVDLWRTSLDVTEASLHPVAPRPSACRRGSAVNPGPETDRVLLAHMGELFARR